MITSAHMQHYYRHLIILVIGLRHSTQAPCFTAPFMPHMTLLGFMCPGPGKLIRSWALSHHAINRPHDMLLFSHSLSPDQLPLLCTSFSFASYHTVYGTHATMSTPTMPSYLNHLYMQIKGDKQNTPHLTYLTLCPCLMLTLALCPMLTLCPTLAPCTLHCAHAHTCTLPPPSLSYLFTPLALLSGCIQLDSALFHSFSPIITNAPITLCTPACSHHASTL